MRRLASLFPKSDRISFIDAIWNLFIFKNLVLSDCDWSEKKQAVSEFPCLNVSECDCSDSGPIGEWRLISSGSDYDWEMAWR